MTFLFGAAALAVFLLLIHGFSHVHPGVLARRIRAGGGLIALLIGIFLVLTGKAVGGIPLLALGLGLLGSGMSGRTRAQPQPKPGAESIVSTDFLEMRLDHASGAMTGIVLRGPFAGRSLDQLDASAFEELALSLDADSLALLEAYLDRRGAGRGADAKRDANRGRDDPRAGPMSKDQAYQILGLQPGAGAEEIHRAHRALMMRLHPDHGGSTYLAAQVNQAKDILLRSHV